MSDTPLSPEQVPQQPSASGAPYIAGGTAVVTGGASGLGAATVAALTARGMTVFVLDLQSGATDEAGIRFIATDVSSAVAVGDAYRKVAAYCADHARPLRVVVNCAGVAPSQRMLRRSGPPDLELIARTISINLVGTLNSMVLGAEVMAAAPLAGGTRGVIVNTASIAAFDGQVGQLAYAASKAGIVGATLPAARDLATHGIRVCTIAPGVMASPMTAGFSAQVRESLEGAIPFPPRLGTPADFAGLVESVIDQPYLNGETIRLDAAVRLPAR